MDFDFDVHPAATVFPMMSEDELNELAADIEENGLLHPIVLDADGELLIDGRNRLEACHRAGVEPQFRRLNGEDHLAFIASANLNRRHMSKSQKAMALAMIYPEAAAVRRKGTGVLDSERPAVSAARLSQARAVLRHSFALAGEVTSGRLSLDAALERVRKEREEAASDEARMAELRRAAPDLANLVDDEELTLSEATAALTNRQEDAAKREDSVRKTLLRVSEGASNIVALANEQFVGELLERLDDEEFYVEWLSRVRLDHERIGEVKSGSDALAKVLKHVARRR